MTVFHFCASDAKRCTLQDVRSFTGKLPFSDRVVVSNEKSQGRTVYTYHLRSGTTSTKTAHPINSMFDVGSTSRNTGGRWFKRSRLDICTQIRVPLDIL